MFVTVDWVIKVDETEKSEIIWGRCAVLCLSMSLFTVLSDWCISWWKWTRLSGILQQNNGYCHSWGRQGLMWVSLGNERGLRVRCDRNCQKCWVHLTENCWTGLLHRLMRSSCYCVCLCMECSLRVWGTVIGWSTVIFLLLVMSWNKWSPFWPYYHTVKLIETQLGPEKKCLLTKYAL